MNDLKYAVAVLRRERGFTAAAVLALALGIGATTAVVSVIYGVLLSSQVEGPLPSALGGQPGLKARPTGM